MNDAIATRNLSWAEIVQKAWGKDWTAPEIGYEFTRRKFNDNRPVHWPPGDQYAEEYANDYADLL